MLLSIFTPLFSLLVGNVSRELSTLLKNIKNRGLKFSKKKPALRKDVSAVESRALSLLAVKPDRLVLPMVVCDFQAVFWVHAPDPGDGIRRCLTGKLLSQPFEGAEPAGHTNPTFRRQVRASAPVQSRPQPSRPGTDGLPGLMRNRDLRFLKNK